MRFVVFNVKYSPNLGDGLLSECLEQELRTCSDAISVVTVDIAGRTDYGLTGRNRRTLLRILEALPLPVRQLVTRLVLRRLVARQVLPRARAALTGASAAVLGGGNLIADADLNFPIKVAAVMDASAAAGIPVAVFGVGVSDGWSTRGTQLFVKAFARRPLAYAMVRDERSQAVWNRNLGQRGARPAELGRDPGLLTAKHFPLVSPPTGNVALCLTDPLLLRYHGAQHIGTELGIWMIDVAKGLAAAGHRLTLFTNGSPEDHAYLLSMAPRFAAACGNAISVAPRFTRPSELARFVGGSSLVIAHRMHACIAAYSYGVPHIGLAWDAKLKSFFDSVRRSTFIIDPAVVDAAEGARLAKEALTVGIDPTLRKGIIHEAELDVANMYAQLSATVAS